jgi:hypothetical protein
MLGPELTPRHTPPALGKSADPAGECRAIL